MYDVTIKDDQLWVSGIDYGYANPSLKIIKKQLPFILCRIKGQSYRLSLGNQIYHQPRYIIFKIENNKIELIDGVWELEYCKQDMKEAKLKALTKLKELKHENN